MKYHIIGIYRFFIKLLAVPKIFDNYSNLTSNVAINKLLSPFYFALIFYYLHFKKGIFLFSPDSYFIGSIPYSIYSTFFYVWCSYQFSPDMDVRVNRPGMNTFPFGATFLNSKIGIIFSPIQVVLGKIWYYFWQPYANFCTHRGVSHWPIFSVFYRVTYIYLWIILFQFIFNFFGLKNISILNFLKYWTTSFYPWNPSFGNITWFVFCLPVFVCDFAHEIIDYIDSKRKGISYCPPQIARGYFSKIFEIFKQIIIKK